MIFEASRAKALNQLNNFVENNLGEYSKLRNFDFGPEKRSNISCLSPYITHGIINEQEVLMDIAEMIIEVFMAESTILRTEKLIRKIGQKSLK